MTGSRASLLSARTADGVTLALRRFVPPGPRRAVCLCTHAMMANSRYLAPEGGGGLVGALVRAGIETFVLDWRGHGQSRPRLSRLTAAWCFDDHVEYDLPAAVGAVCETAGVASTELVYSGHSLGGLVGLAALGTGAVRPPARLALWATAAWLPGRSGSLLRRATMAAFHLSSLPLGRAPIRALGVGTDDEPRGYVAQLARWAKSGRWTSREHVDYLAGLGTIDAPVWTACGMGDRLCRPRDVEVIRRRLRGAGPLRRVGREHGDPIDADHFTLFTHRAMARLWAECAEFLAS